MIYKIHDDYHITYFQPSMVDECALLLSKEFIRQNLLWKAFVTDPKEVFYKVRLILLQGL